eukprot:14063186-Alexandrium_andersonii.AAC.1
MTGELPAAPPTHCRKRRPDAETARAKKGWHDGRLSDSRMREVVQESITPLSARLSGQVMSVQSAKACKPSSPIQATINMNPHIDSTHAGYDYTRYQCERRSHCQQPSPPATFPHLLAHIRM